MFPYEERVFLQIQLGIILYCQTAYFHTWSFQIYYPKDLEWDLWFTALSEDTHHHLIKILLQIHISQNRKSQQNLWDKIQPLLKQTNLEGNKTQVPAVKILTNFPGFGVSSCYNLFVVVTQKCIWRQFWACFSEIVWKLGNTSL